MAALSEINFIVLISDTFRRDHLGCYGNGTIITPNLDRLAAESVRFDRYTIGSFPTLPTRADLLTGALSFPHFGWEPLPLNTITIPQLFAEAGYLTMGIVDVPFYTRRGYNYDLGFRDFLTIRGQRPVEREDVSRSWRSEADRMTAHTITESVRWLERNRRERFLLWIDMWDPHEPWDAPAYYTELYRKNYDGRLVHPSYAPVPNEPEARQEVEIGHATYCGEITYVDRWIGNLLSAIDVFALRDNTVVIFLSDHGFYFGEHGLFGKAHHAPGAADAPDAVFLSLLRWSPLYQEITGVPLLIRGPWRPRSTSALISPPDLSATILALAGIEQPPTVKGRPFSQLLTHGGDSHRDLTLSSHPFHLVAGATTRLIDDVQRGVEGYMPLTVTTGDYTLLLGGPEDTVELYNIHVDPKEEANIAHRAPGKVLEIGAAAIEMLRREETPDAFIAPRVAALENFRRRAM